MQDLPYSQISFSDLFVSLTKKEVWIIIFIGITVLGNKVINGFVWDDFTFILNNV